MLLCTMRCGLYVHMANAAEAAHEIALLLPPMINALRSTGEAGGAAALTVGTILTCTTRGCIVFWNALAATIRCVRTIVRKSSPLASEMIGDTMVSVVGN